MMPTSRKSRENARGLRMGQIVGRYFTRDIIDRNAEGVIPYQQPRPSDTFDEDNIRPPVHCMEGFMYPLGKAQCNAPASHVPDIGGIDTNGSEQEPDSMVMYSMPTESEASSDSAAYDGWIVPTQHSDIDDTQEDSRCSDLMILPTVSEISGGIIEHFRGKTTLTIKGPFGVQRSHWSRESANVADSEHHGTPSETPQSYRSLFYSHTDSTAESTSDSDEEADDSSSDGRDESESVSEDESDDDYSYRSEGSAPFDEPDPYEYREVVSITPSVCSHIYIEKRPTGEEMEASFEMVPVDASDSDEKTCATMSDVTDANVAPEIHPLVQPVFPPTQDGPHHDMKSSQGLPDYKGHAPVLDQSLTNISNDPTVKTSTAKNKPAFSNEILDLPSFERKTDAVTLQENPFLERSTLERPRLHLANIPEENALGSPIAVTSPHRDDKDEMMLAKLDKAIEETWASVKASKEYSARTSIALDSPTSRSATSIECFVPSDTPPSGQYNFYNTVQMGANSLAQVVTKISHEEAMDVNATTTHVTPRESNSTVSASSDKYSPTGSFLTKDEIDNMMVADTNKDDAAIEPVPDLVEPESVGSDTFEDVPVNLSTATNDMYCDDLPSKPDTTNLNLFNNAATPKTCPSRAFEDMDLFAQSLPHGLNRTESGNLLRKKGPMSSGLYLACSSTYDEFADTVPYTLTPHDTKSFEDVYSSWVDMVTSFEQQTRKLNQSSAAFLSFDEDTSDDAIPTIITEDDETENSDELMSALTCQDTEPEQLVKPEAKEDSERRQWELTGRVLLIAAVVHLWTL